MATYSINVYKYLAILSAIALAVLGPLHGQESESTRSEVRLKYPVILSVNKLVVPAKMNFAEGLGVQISSGKALKRSGDATYFLFGYGSAVWGDTQKTTSDEGRNEISFLSAAVEYRRTWPIFNTITVYLSGGGGVGDHVCAVADDWVAGVARTRLKAIRLCVGAAFTAARPTLRKGARHSLT